MYLHIHKVLMKYRIMHSLGWACLWTTAWKATGKGPECIQTWEKASCSEKCCSVGEWRPTFCCWSEVIYWWSLIVVLIAQACICTIRDNVGTGQRVVQQVKHEEHLLHQKVSTNNSYTYTLTTIFWVCRTVMSMQAYANWQNNLQHRIVMKQSTQVWYLKDKCLATFN